VGTDGRCSSGGVVGVDGGAFGGAGFLRWEIIPRRERRASIAVDGCGGLLGAAMSMVVRSPCMGFVDLWSRL